MDKLIANQIKFYYGTMAFFFYSFTKLEKMQKIFALTPKISNSLFTSEAAEFLMKYHLLIN